MEAVTSCKDVQTIMILYLLPVFTMSLYKQHHGYPGIREMSRRRKLCPNIVVVLVTIIIIIWTERCREWQVDITSTFRPPEYSGVWEWWVIYYPSQGCKSILSQSIPYHWPPMTDSSSCLCSLMGGPEMRDRLTEYRFTSLRWVDITHHFQTPEYSGGPKVEVISTCHIWPSSIKFRPEIPKVKMIVPSFLDSTIKKNQ